MKTEKIKISKLQENPNNPRLLRADKKEKLEKSLREFPEMLSARPIVVNQDYTILGGNMRYKALLATGTKEVEVMVVDWSEEKQREFIIKDNVGFGEWDWDLLHEWNKDELVEWGMDLPDFFEEDKPEDEPYTKKIDAPNYEPSTEKPDYAYLVNKDRTTKFIKNIENSNISIQDKEFLKLTAYRHLVFDYSKIADFYAHSDKEVQELMEDLALIIIDFEKAIKLGYVTINEKIAEQYLDEHGAE